MLRASDFCVSLYYIMLAAAQSPLRPQAGVAKNPVEARRGGMDNAKFKLCSYKTLQQQDTLHIAQTSNLRPCNPRVRNAGTFNSPVNKTVVEQTNPWDLPLR